MAGAQARDGLFFALEDVSFGLEEGSCAVIVGANGSGKSVLMSIIASLDTATSGSAAVSAAVGLVFQEPDTQILGETPREDISFGPRNAGLSKEEVRARVQAALSQSGLVSKADFPARSLSGGEKRRLAVAGVLAMDAGVIIFDEPYANMDYPGVLQVNALIKDLHAQSKTIIILTHELEKCLALCDRFIALFRGKKVFDGSAQAALGLDLEAWGIHHPLRGAARGFEDLLWQ